MKALGRFYVAFLIGALVRRMVPYAAVIYGFDVLGGHHWSGLFYFCLVTPYLLFSVGAGVLIDRLSAPRVLRGAAFAAVAWLALLMVAQHREWSGGAVAHGWTIATLIFGYGTAYAFAYPAFIAAIPQLVPPAAVNRTTVLINVLALASLAYAPLAVGALREGFSWPRVFAIFAAAALVSAMALPRSPVFAPPPAPSGTAPTLRELAAYCRRQPRLAAVLIVAAAFSALVVGPLEVLLPRFAEHSLALSPFAAGAFIAVGGTGLVVGSLAALPLLGRVKLGAWLCGTGSLGAACIVALTHASRPAAFPLFFISGVLGGLFSSLSIAATQANAAAEMRGRVMGLFSLIVGGVPGFGGIAAGTLASAIGTVPTIRVAFVLATLALAALFALLAPLRSPAENSPAAG